MCQKLQILQFRLSFASLVSDTLPPPQAERENSDFSDIFTHSSPYFTSANNPSKSYYRDIQQDYGKRYFSI